MSRTLSADELLFLARLRAVDAKTRKVRKENKEFGTKASGPDADELELRENDGEVFTTAKSVDTIHMMHPRFFNIVGRFNVKANVGQSRRWHELAYRLRALFGGFLTVMHDASDNDDAVYSMCDMAHYVDEILKGDRVSKVPKLLAAYMKRQHLLREFQALCDAVGSPLFDAYTYDFGVTMEILDVWVKVGDTNQLMFDNPDDSRDDSDWDEFDDDAIIEGHDGTDCANCVDDKSSSPRKRIKTDE